MKAQFVERYDSLEDLKFGEIGVSKDRSRIFVCGYLLNKKDNIFEKAILELNNLGNQYLDKVDMKQPIKKLQTGDKLLLEI